jgi:hypothetical protein
MDINYRKHYNHGIELRIFDWFPENKLQKVIEFIVYVCEVALIRAEPEQAVLSETWNLCVVGVLREGGAYKMCDEITALYERILGVELLGKNLNMIEAFEYIFKELKRKYKGGKLARRLL